MNTQDKKSFKALIQETLLEFWDNALEPMLNKIYGRIQKVEKKVGNLEKKVGNLEEDVKDIKQVVVKSGERIDDIGADVIGHEKRLVRIEKKIHLPA